jgi:hypothetical protein
VIRKGHEEINVYRIMESRNLQDREGDGRMDREIGCELDGAD